MHIGRYISWVLAACSLAYPSGTYAGNPHMEFVIDQIKNDTATMRLGDAYVLVLDPVEHKTIVRYDPETESAPETLTVTREGELYDVTNGSRVATCRNTMIDVGVLGMIGPRDGTTTCTGYPGAAAMVAPGRIRFYHEIIQQILARATSIFMIIVPDDDPEENKTRQPI